MNIHFIERVHIGERHSRATELNTESPEQRPPGRGWQLRLRPTLAAGGEQVGRGLGRTKGQQVPLEREVPEVQSSARVHN